MQSVYRYSRVQRVTNAPSHHRLTQGWSLDACRRMYDWRHTWRWYDVTRDVDMTSHVTLTTARQRVVTLIWRHTWRWHDVTRDVDYCAPVSRHVDMTRMSRWYDVTRDVDMTSHVTLTTARQWVDVVFTSWLISRLQVTATIIAKNSCSFSVEIPDTPPEKEK